MFTFLDFPPLSKYPLNDAIPSWYDVIQKPKVLNILQAEDAEKMQKLLDGLEDLDDVQEVYTTAIIDVAG